MLFVKLHSHNLYANTNSALDTTDTQAETTQVLVLEWNFWYHPPLLAKAPCMHKHLHITTASDGRYRCKRIDITDTSSANCNIEYYS